MVISPPNKTRLCLALLPMLAILPASAGKVNAVSSDTVVLRWNQATLDAIRTTRTAAPVAARALAITHTCMFDAWAAYDAAAMGTRLGGDLRRPQHERTNANKETAISFAAYRALVDLFPSLRMIKFDPLMHDLGLDPADASTDVQTPNGIGNVACKAVLDFRHGDGANQLGERHPGTYSDYTGFTPANTAEVLRDPNRWQPLLVNGVAQRWLLPHWGMVTPFAASISDAQFRNPVLSEGPYLYPTRGYWQQALDVAELSGQLGDREKAIAEYWADGVTTVSPPGHWCLFAQTVSRRNGYPVDQDVKLFFILTNALMDSTIAAWQVKRSTDSIRPVTVIRSLFSHRQIRAWAGRGLGVRTIYGADFRSYLPTPPFASYVSGHSTLSAAAAEILKRFTGSDYFGESFTVLPGTSLVEPGLTPGLPITLSWRTFSDAADEAGMSRRYGGIHFENDDLAGRTLGRRVGAEVWSKAMRYVNGTLKGD